MKNKITKLEGEFRKEAEEILSGKSHVAGGMRIILPQIGEVLSQSMVSSRRSQEHYFRILRKDNEGTIYDNEIRYSPQEDFVMEDLAIFVPGNKNYQMMNKKLKGVGI